jgi:hypothetical protein
MITTIDKVITDLGDYGNPCAEWTNGELYGRIEHLPLPAARVGDIVDWDCLNCGKYLYTERGI